MRLWLQALNILQAIRASRVSVVQPPHWLAEVAQSLCAWILYGVRQPVSLLHALEFPVAATSDLYQKACELSALLHQHLFDTLYHAVALTEPGAILVTADEHYYREAHKAGRIMRLKEYSPATLE